MAYTFEPLGKSLSVCVSAEHTFGTDAFLLSAFASVKAREAVCDLGTGCGIIPILWFRPGHTPPQKVVAVDIQPQAIDQLQTTLRRFPLPILPLCEDLKTLSLDAGSFDLVTCNPPYKSSGSGIVSRSAADRIARHETLCTMDDIAACAGRLLKFGGRFCLCQRPERLCDVICAMKAHGLEPKRLRFVHKDASSAPWLFLIEGKKGAKPFLKVEKPFLTDSEEMKRLYREDTP